MECQKGIQAFAIEYYHGMPETDIPGPRFKAAAIGEMVLFLHSVIKVRYTFTVQELEEQTVDVG